MWHLSNYKNGGKAPKLEQMKKGFISSIFFVPFLNNDFIHMGFFKILLLFEL